MRVSTFAAALTMAATLIPSLGAQVYGGPDPDRMASTVMIFAPDGMQAAASISYSQPDWKEEYTGMLEQLKGKKLRLGKNWWTSLQTATDLKIGDKSLPAGSYVLGLECDKDGGFHLLLIDAGHAMKHKMMPWAGQTWKDETKVALDFHKAKNEKSADKMEIELTAAADATGTFAIRWGKHELNTKVSYGADAAEANAKKGKEMKKDKMKK